MQKEILTKKRIAEELKKIYSWKGFLLGIGFFLVVTALMMWALSLLYEAFLMEQLLLRILYRLLQIVIGGGMAALSVYVFISTYRTRQSVDCGNFQVVTDRVVRTEERYDPHRHKRCWYLHFASFGKYEIMGGTHYDWSERYAMTDEGIYNTAIEGDTFYIVTDNNKTILQVYNTKFFEYTE